VIARRQLRPLALKAAQVVDERLSDCFHAHPGTHALGGGRGLRCDVGFAAGSGFHKLTSDGGSVNCDRYLSGGGIARGARAPSEHDAKADDRTVQRLRADEGPLEGSDADVSDRQLIVKERVTESNLGMRDDAPTGVELCRGIDVSADAETAALK